jgi:UDP-glucose:(heptosyl)LPS alpha-1,3-glucosyltransferase
MISDDLEICLLRRNQTRFGGAENYLARLSNELGRIEVKHELIYSSMPKFLPSWLHSLLYNFHVCRTKGRRFYFSLERITCPDIYRAGDGVHRQFLTTKRKSINLLNPVYLYLEKRCFNNARRIIVNSNMVKQEIMQHYAVDPNKISLVYSGIEFGMPDTKDKSIRDEFNIDPNRRIILFVGSGFERKGVREMLLLLAGVEEDYTAIIVGKDKHIQKYKDLSISLGIENKVLFTGPRTDVDKFYHESDIFLLPARYEPFSNAVLEAMAFGNAVITTRQNGAAEIIQDELVMDNSEDGSVLPEISKLLVDAAYLDQVKQDNLKTVKDFTIERNARETLKIIREVVSERDLSAH